MNVESKEKRGQKVAGEDFSLASNVVNSSSLTPSQQLLLMQYFDGECGLFSRIRARSLLARSEQAQAYELFHCDIETLRQEQLALDIYNRYGSTSSLAESSTRCAKVWERIAVRIDQEQRAELFLGERRSSRVGDSREAGSSLWEGYFEKFAWGATGACATAVLGVLFISQGYLPGSSDLQISSLNRSGEITESPIQLASVSGERTLLESRGNENSDQNTSSNVVQVSSSNGGEMIDQSRDQQVASPRFSDIPVSRIPQVIGVSGRQDGGQSRATNSLNGGESVFYQPGQTLQVDWMRGNGAPQLIQDNDPDGAIIWIARNAPAAGLSSRPQILQSSAPDLFDIEMSTLERPADGFFE